MSDTTNDGGPAFAQDLQGRRGDDPSLQGLTKRELFAAMAMQGMLADPEYLVTPAERADLAVGHADALLAALSRHDAALLAPPAERAGEER